MRRHNLQWRERGKKRIVFYQLEQGPTSPMLLSPHSFHLVRVVAFLLILSVNTHRFLQNVPFQQDPYIDCESLALHLPRTPGGPIVDLSFDDLDALDDLRETDIKDITRKT